ncbi:MAG: hypothetical protein WD872_15440 [Pirellulaceae bacterium]
MLIVADDRATVVKSQSPTLLAGRDAGNCKDFRWLAIHPQNKITGTQVTDRRPSLGSWNHGLSVQRFAAAGRSAEEGFEAVEIEKRLLRPGRDLRAIAGERSRRGAPLGIGQVWQGVEHGGVP